MGVKPVFVDGSALQNWIVAFFTLALFSIAWKDNPVYRFVEHLYVGMAAAYGVGMAWFNYGRPNIEAIQKGNISYIIPIIIGLMIYTRYIKSLAWISRYTISFTVGTGAGYILSRDFRTNIVNQLAATFKPFWVPGNISETINNLILVIGVMGTMAYFLFTARRKGVVGVAANIGKWIMMIAFGTAFGNTVLGRISLFLGRMQFLLGDWLKIIK